MSLKKILNNMSSNDTIVLPEYIGVLPYGGQGISPENGVPDLYTDPETLYIHDMFIMELVPCGTKLNADLRLMGPSESKMDEYKKYLEDIAGVTIPNTDSLKLLVQPQDLTMNESFSNTYGSSFMQDMINQITSFTDKIKEVRQFLGSDTSAAINSKIASGVKGAAEFLGIQNKEAINMLSDISQVVSGGNKMIFPKVWKSSNAERSYNFTVRLVNPHPGDKEATEKYIIGPIAALLMFVLPRSTTINGMTYNVPFFCKCFVRGLLELPFAGISSIQILKGGTNKSFGVNQTPRVVEVSINIKDMYDVIIASSNMSGPTLRRYLNIMRKPRGVKYTSDELFYDTQKDSSYIKNIKKTAYKYTKEKTKKITNVISKKSTSMYKSVKDYVYNYPDEATREKLKSIYEKTKDDVIKNKNKIGSKLITGLNKIKSKMSKEKKSYASIESMKEEITKVNNFMTTGNIESSKLVENIHLSKIASTCDQEAKKIQNDNNNEVNKKALNELANIANNKINTNKKELVSKAKELDIITEGVIA